MQCLLGQLKLQAVMAWIKENGCMNQGVFSHPCDFGCICPTLHPPFQTPRSAYASTFQYWALRKMYELERSQWRETQLIKALEKMIYEARLKELGLFNTNKRKLRE